MKKIERKWTPLDRLLMEKQMVQTKCQEVEQQIKDDLQYVGDHSGEWILEQLSLLFFSKTDLPTTSSKVFN